MTSWRWQREDVPAGTPLQGTAEPVERGQIQPAYAEKDLFRLNGTARSVVGFCARDHTAADITAADLTAAGITAADLTAADLTAADLAAAYHTAADLTAADHSPSAERQWRRQTTTIPRPFSCEFAESPPRPVDQSSLSVQAVQETGLSAQAVQETGIGLPSQMAL